MSQPRRKCKLAESSYRNIDLRLFSQTIINVINETVPNKNPQVFNDYFSTDPLTQTESVLLGRALSKIPELNCYGKTVTIFRLFDGKTYENENSTKPIQKSKTIKGGRIR